MNGKWRVTSDVHPARFSLYRALPRFIAFVFMLCTFGHSASTYHIDTAGSNGSNGLSASSAWKDFVNVNSRVFQPGDSVLLKRGCAWRQRLDITGAGTAEKWIFFGSYGSGNKPKIQLNNLKTDRCVWVHTPDFMRISDLDLCNAGMGLMVIYQSFGHEGLKISDCYIHDIEQIWRATTDNYQGFEPRQLDYPVWTSTGIMISYRINDSDSAPKPYPLPSPSQYVAKGIEIDGCETYRTDPVTIQYRGYGTDSHVGTFRDIVIRNCNFHDFKSDFNFENLTGLTMLGCRIVNGASVKQPQGTTATFFYYARDAHVTNNLFDTVKHVGSYDESHIDLEAYCDTFSFHGNYFANAAGAGVEMLQINNRPGDYMRSIKYAGNSFVRNDWANNNEGAIWLNAAAGSGSGSITENLFTGPGKCRVGDFSKFTVSNNDSVAEANVFNSGAQFGAVQGAGNWWYQYKNSADGSWTNAASYNSTARQWSVGSGGISRFNLLPDSASAPWICKMWRTPQSGTVSLFGQACKNDIDGGDGVRVSIVKNTTRLWPAGAASDTAIAAGNRTGLPTNVRGVPVAAGDTIRFIVYMGGNARHDLTSWLPSVAYTSLATASSHQAAPAPSRDALLSSRGIGKGRTSITFCLEQPARVGIDVCDSRGRLVERLDPASYSSGPHNVVWEAGNRPDGIYFAVLKVSGKTFTRKIGLLRSR